VVVEEMTRRQQERDAETDDADTATDEIEDPDADDGVGGLLDGLLRGGDR
jgi:hypothetical protein